MKQKRFLSRAASLGFYTLILRGAGTVFGIWLSNTVGAEGTGLYQLVSSVYFLAVTFSTSGVTIAVTRIVSEQLAKGSAAGAKRAFRLGMLLSFVLGLAASALLFFAAPAAAAYWLCEPRAEIPLRIFSLGLPFLSTASVIRGYFLGRQRTGLSVNGDIAEQIVVMAVTVPLVTAFLPRGLTSVCIAMVIGSVASEILSCLYALLLCICFRLKKEGHAPKGIGRQLLSITLPVAVGNNIRAVLTALENVLTPAGLRKNGAAAGEALSQYGIVKGMVWPVLMLPTVLLAPFASLLIPEVSAAAAIGDYRRVRVMTHRCLKATLLYAFFIAGLLFSFAEPLCAILFPSTPAAGYVRALCPLIPLLYMDQIVDSILKGLNQQVASMKYNMADAAMRVLLVFVLVPVSGMRGWLFMLYVGTIFNASMSAARLIKVSHVLIDWRCWLVRPLSSIVISCILSALLIKNRLVGMLFCGISYIVLLFAFGCITRRELHLFLRPAQKVEKAKIKA